jgi:hypothetical protein
MQEWQLLYLYLNIALANPLTMEDSFCFPKANAAQIILNNKKANNEFLHPHLRGPILNAANFQTLK